MGRIFTGDFSTRDFKQWDVIQNTVAKDYSEGTATYNGYSQYPLQVVTEDRDCGYAARVEVRPGDINITSNERCEVADDPRAINVSRWEAFSVKFDSAFPLNSAGDHGWGVTNQWPDASSLAWGFGNHFDGLTPSGTWTLIYTDLSDAPNSIRRLLDVPMNRGQWIDVKMHVGWYDTAGAGFVRVWINGIRQTLRYTSTAWAGGGTAGGQTFTGKTVLDNTSGTFFYKCGLYRQAGVSYPTGIVHHANYRIADSEDGL
jgi:hypothetical protein